jgi:hypothetical protein
MNENRGNYRKYLHGVIFLMSVIFGSSGIFGYIHFTDNVDQLVSDNLPYGPLSVALQVTLCIAVLFTYPLQMYPIVEIAENFLFKETKKRSTLITSFNQEDGGIQRDKANVQYRGLVPGDESSEEESLEEPDCGDGESSAHVSSSNEGSALQKSDGAVVQRPGHLCKCDMVNNNHYLLNKLIYCRSEGEKYTRAIGEA